MFSAISMGYRYQCAYLQYLILVSDYISLQVKSLVACKIFHFVHCDRVYFVHVQDCPFVYVCTGDISKSQIKDFIMDNVDLIMQFSYYYDMKFAHHFSYLYQRELEQRGLPPFPHYPHMLRLGEDLFKYLKRHPTVGSLQALHEVIVQHPIYSVDLKLAEKIAKFLGKIA